LMEGCPNIMVVAYSCIDVAYRCSEIIYHHSKIS
jgi:hypothetical protein